MGLFKYFWQIYLECSSVLAWRIPGTGEPGGLPSMGLPIDTTEAT